MGVYARQHAADLATNQQIDLGSSGYLGLSPAARIMLLHIASLVPENGEFKLLWDPDARYYESLGYKGRALGYDVPPKMYKRSTEPNSTRPGAVSDEVYNAVKAAVNKVMRELVKHGLIKVEVQGRPGHTAEYSLPFLRRGCRICAYNKNGEVAFRSSLHKKENREGVEFFPEGEFSYQLGEQ